MPFDYSGQTVRTIVIDGEPWFVLADLCAVLGLARRASAVAERLDPDGVRQTDIIDSMGRTQTATIVNEPAMYEVVIRSDKPEAVTFRRWLTGTVLPTLRKTGTFQVERLTPLQLAEKLVDAERRVEAANAKVLELEGPAAHAETFRAAEGLCTIGDLANRFQVWAKVEHPDVKVLHKDVFDHAALCGLIIRGNTVRHNQPTSQGIKAGWVKAHRAEYDTDTRGMQTTVSTRLTSRGEARLWDHLVAYVKANQTLAIRKAS